MTDEIVWKDRLDVILEILEEHKFIQAALCVRRVAEHIEELETRLAGVDAGTHVIVPVEPTETMILMGNDIIEQPYANKKYRAPHAYRAMISAAQEYKNGCVNCGERYHPAGICLRCGKLFSAGTAQGKNND